MIEAKPDWVISRQRAWGVPIAVFVREYPDGSVELLQDEQVNKRIGDAFEAEGADPGMRTARASASSAPLANEPWQKVDDILDVWLDSGSSTPSRWRTRAHFQSLAGISARYSAADTVIYLRAPTSVRLVSSS